MTFLFWLIIFGAVFYYIGRNGKQSKSEVDEQLTQQNRNWYIYIKSFKKLHTDKLHKKFIDDILRDVKQQGLVDSEFDGHDELEAYSKVDEPEDALVTDVNSDETTGPQIQQNYQVAATSAPSKPKAEIQLDNASLLLYLGAFIFVASIGLFVAFGDFGGYLKTLVVLLLAVILYGAGAWLYSGSKKYTQVGIAFAAIGMAIVPFVGLAAYLYIFEESNGAAVWFVTSVLCLVIYVHALIFFKKPFLNYIFIFTLLSLFESSVAVVAVPIYYFGWAMAFLGICLGFVATFKNIWPDFKESAYASGQLLVPLSVVISLALLQSQGSIQMGVSLLLAAAFYGLQALNTTDKLREKYLSVTQIFSIGAVLWLAYGFTDSLESTALAALLVNTVQLCAFVLLQKSTIAWRNFASILVVSSILGGLLAIQSPIILLLAVCLFSLAGFAIWLMQDRLEGYVIAMAGIMTVPVVVGQLIVDGSVTPLMQCILLLVSLLLQWLVYATYRTMSKKAALWHQTAQMVFVVSLAVVAVAAFFTSPFTCLIVCAVAALLAAALAYIDNDPNWAAIAGLVVSIPVARSFVDSQELLACVLIALGFNILAALKYRQEFNRWVGSILWFIVPIALGNGVLGDKWTTEMYAYTYMLTALGFVFARAVARGVWFVSGKVPMASYAKTASLSYVVGYGVAIGASLWLSFLTTDSQVLTTGLLCVTFVLVLLLAKYIEKDPELLCALPILAQIILLSALRPIAYDSQTTTTFVLFSSVLATAIFVIVNKLYAKGTAQSLKLVSLGFMFLAPLCVLFFGSVWAMPVALMVASVAMYYHFKEASQSEHEAIGAIFTVGILWLMWQLGVDEIQAFTHVVVALFALYAVLRSRRGEKQVAEQYILALLATATVPLTLQALSGASGGLYGWWLLLEQIAFIIIGMFINNKLMIQWGLYVAVAAVLYQLRGLGWAALAFLGIFVIAMAAYQIQRINKN